MLIVATAGHIDHGKTALVRALTGVDTDTLPQERARGISIDLGFAYWEAAPGELVAFVDVPGHQRFIRNMLAGVAGIHFAMVVVAVDDGPMPQTLEHIRILDFLGVRDGVIVLSKADTAGGDRIEEVRTAMRDMLQGTSLAHVPALAVSARTGAGIGELKSLLAQRAREHEQVRHQAAPRAQRARFAIDRAFTVRGAGTVVTGTVYDGELACDDRLSVFPGGADLRVRGIQVHGRDVRRVGSGERAAINVTGAQMPELARGDWLADPAIASSGQLVDVQLSVLADAAALRHASRVRLHLGASEVGCRLLLHGRAQLEPGATAPARLHLDRPVLAVNADRFVIRDGTATQTLAGGLVVDPCPLSRRQFLGETEFRALASGDHAMALRAMLAARCDEGVDLARFERIFNLAGPATDAALQACDARRLGKARPVIVTRAGIDALTTRMATALRQDERASVGINELRQAVAPGLAPEAFEFLLRERAERLDISLAGGSVSLRQRRDTVRSADQAAWERVRPILARSGLQPPDIAALAHTCGLPAGRLRAVLHAQARLGDVFQLQPEKYIVREVVAQLAAAAATTAARQPQGCFTAAQFRDTIGTGRTLAIPALEMLDALGVTRRNADLRTIARDPQALFGPATPFRMPGERERAAPAPAPHRHKGRG